MHSFANLATLQTALATFFLKESTQPLFRLRESPVLPREREVLLSQHTHTSLSLSPSICSVSVQHEHTHLSISLALSVCLLSFCSARAHTSPSLSASAQFLFSVRMHTHLSLSLLSTCTHTSISLSASPQFLFSAQQRRAELNSAKHRYHVDCFSNFTCKYNQNHSTAIVIILWVFYLIRQRLDYKDFCAD